MFLKKKLTWLASLLIIASGLIGWQAFSGSPGVLTVAILDVGQGDSIFIETPNGKQVLIDGGATKKVLLELGKVMPVGDNSLDLVIATHPDKDHIGGLIPVLENYDVSQILESPVEGTTKTFSIFKDAVAKEKSDRVLAEAGQTILLDSANNIYLKILWPGKVASGVLTNEAAIVAELVFGESEFLFTADIPAFVEETLAASFPEEINTDVLKVAHHGSRYSSSFNFLEAASPDVAVISAGKNNSYGHPHKDTLGRLTKLKIPILGTYDEGTIIFESDGSVIRRVR